MKEDKSKFLKQFVVKKTKEDFDPALKGKDTIPSVLSMPKKKRDADSDSESLEKNLKSKDAKKGKKQKTHHWSLYDLTLIKNSILNNSKLD